MNITQFDRYQGRDADGQRFGYIGSDDHGGYYFTWMGTLEETLDSIEADEVIKPSFDWDNEARDYLKSEITDFAEQLAELAARDERAE